jgi:hypothetical protein
VVVIHCGCDVLYYLVDSRVVLLSVRGRERVCAVSTYWSVKTGYHCCMLAVNLYHLMPGWRH